MNQKQEDDRPFWPLFLSAMFGLAVMGASLYCLVIGLICGAHGDRIGFFIYMIGAYLIAWTPIPNCKGVQK